jgi:4-hydroxy-4-methyl-2-oxoglutarate aldolase
MSAIRWHRHNPIRDAGLDEFVILALTFYIFNREVTPMHSTATLREHLYTAVLSDVMDEMGLTKQAMRPFVRPIDDTLVFVGRARTALFTNTYSVKDGENPYELEIRLVDDLKPGDVAVVACGGPTDRIAPWGELLSTAATARGAIACVTDGWCATCATSRR